MSDYYFKSFKFCPVCGNKYSEQDFDKNDTFFDCKKCGYRFYQNQNAVASVIIPNSDNPYEVLLATRNIEPAKGKLDTPGGFPKFDEELKDTIIREMKEETNLDIVVDNIFDVRKNNYEFKGRIYKHAVVYFLAKPISKDSIRDIKLDKTENSRIKFYDLRNIEKFKDKLGFVADQPTLIKYRDHIKPLAG